MRSLDPRLREEGGKLKLQILSNRLGFSRILLPMTINPKDWPGAFAHVHVMYWPVLFWNLICFTSWLKAEEAKHGWLDYIIDIDRYGVITPVFIGDGAPDANEQLLDKLHTQFIAQISRRMILRTAPLRAVWVAVKRRRLSLSAPQNTSISVSNSATPPLEPG